MSTIKKTAVAAVLFAVGVLSGAGFSATAPSDMPVRLNSVGFAPNLPMKATIKAPGSDIAPGTAFFVKKVSDNSVVHRGETEPSVKSGATNEYVWVADFTHMETGAAGEYYVDVPGVGRSANFKISGDAYLEAYRLSMLGMYLMRCGAAVSADYGGVTFSHAACHLSDGTIHSLAGQSAASKDGVGGWHDAGDYNKYVVNSGVTVGMMLFTTYLL